MKIRATIGGKYTNVSVDMPIPVFDWLWQRVHRKYFAEEEIEFEIKKKEMLQEAKERKKQDEYIKLCANACKVSEDIAKDEARKFFAEYREYCNREK